MEAINTKQYSYRFSKEERLCSKKSIETLFQNGKTIFSFPFKIFFQIVENTKLQKVQVMISVPKRQFKKAVDRNKIKRLFKESYRKNRNKLFFDQNNKAIQIAFVYIHKEIVEYNDLNKKVIITLEKINSTLLIK